MATSPNEESLLDQQHQPTTNNNNAIPMYPTIPENADETDSDADCDSPKFLSCPGIPPLCGQLERKLHLSRQDTLDSPLMEEDEEDFEDATSLTSADSVEALRLGSSASLPARCPGVSGVKHGGDRSPTGPHGLDRFAHFTIKKQTSYRRNTVLSVSHVPEGEL